MKFTDRLRSEAPMHDPDMQCHIYNAAGIIDELEAALKKTTAVAVSYFSGVGTSWEQQAKDALAKLEKLNRV